MDGHLRPVRGWPSATPSGRGDIAGVSLGWWAIFFCPNTPGWCGLHLPTHPPALGRRKERAPAVRLRLALRRPAAR